MGIMETAFPTRVKGMINPMAMTTRVERKRAADGRL